MTTVLITGANGFLGSNLYQYLSLDTNLLVYGLVRKNSFLGSSLDTLKKSSNLITFNEDLRELIPLIENIKPDIVIHTATYFHAEHSTDDIYPMIEGVYTFGNFVLESLAKIQKNLFFINTGSSWQHYENSTNYRAACLHSAHKEAFEKLLEYYSDAFNIKFTTLKLFDTYGPNDQRKKIVNILIDQILKDCPIDLSYGEQLIDLVHINDVCKAYHLIIDMYLNDISINHSYGISSGHEISLKEISLMISSIINPGYDKFNWGARPYRKREVKKNWRNNMNLIPNWYQDFTLYDGLHSLIDKKNGKF
ncbi:NAD-dependent epimerase/dehydratase family protein [Candidatus Methylopumilus planktonicus]|uniref:NAD-dependent epimerase/dehydratase family protein n=1 Tax=Candidatus Methylopumilus planktonicus TaxID=1581557 RepID=UPI003BEF25B5